jgi:hypothetical protein
MATILRENITYTREEVPHTLEGFKNWEFSSGSVIDEDFKVFARLFKKHIANNLPPRTRLVTYGRGHYEVSGFIERQGKCVYFAISDVRYFPGNWRENILIRIASSDHDYTGGSNHYTRLEEFKEQIDNLLNSQ